MLKSATYNRVSSESQREDETIEDQLDKNRTSCKRNGSKIYKEYQDDGWTGATLRRPGMTKLREDAKKGLFSELYITNFSRLARNVIKQGLLVEELRKNDVKIFENGKPLEDTAQGKFLLTTIGAAYELHKEMIIENTSDGRWRSARKGKMIQATTPYGLRFKKDERGSYVRDEKGGKIIEKDKKETAIVELMFDTYLQVQSPYFVAKEFYNKGIKTRHNKNWAESQIRFMLQSKVYLGEWYFGRRKSAEPKTRKNKDFIRLVRSSAVIRPEGEWIKFEVPAIITKEKFEMVQEIFKKKRKTKHNLKRPYLLNGFLYCGDCGAKMYGKKGISGNKEYFYYACSRKSKPFDKIKCKSFLARTEILDEAIWNKVIELFDKPEKVFEYAKYLNEKENNVSIIEKKRQSLLKKKEFYKESKLKMLDLYEVEEIDKEILLFRMQQTKKAEQEVITELRKIEIAFNQLAKKKIIIERMQALSNTIGEELRHFTLEQKIDFLKKFMDTISFKRVNSNYEINMEGAFPILEKMPNLVSDIALALK